MVRTQHRVTSVPFEPSRIFAYSTAIALHALALGLLLVPLSQAPIRTTAAQEPRWQIPEPRVLPPPPPSPPEAVITTSPPAPSRPPALPLAVETAPVPVFAVEAVIAPPADVVAAPDNTPSSTSTTGTALEGVELRYLRAPAPAYPREALLANAQGTVILRVLVDVDGSPMQVSVERGSGNRSLDNAARRQVLRQWKFQPASDQGRPVQAWGLVPIEFKLD